MMLKIKITLCIIIGAFISVSYGKPSVKAKPVYASIAVDAKNGKVLYQENATIFTPPASLTKIMTLLLIFDALEQGKLRLTDMLPISKYAASQSPCKLWLKQGGYISVKNLILGIITKSANDAAVVVSEFLAGTEENFARQMTQRARYFGMYETTFKNASGLPASGQVTTARDMALLGLITHKHYQKYFHLFKIKEFCYNNACHVNHNYRLLSQKHLKFDGIKTGFVNASGFNVIASHHNDQGHRMIIVVMGGATAAWRDKHVMDIVQRIKKSCPSIHVQKNDILLSKETNEPMSVEKNQIFNIEPEETSLDDVIHKNSSIGAVKNFALMLGYYGSQVRAETFGKYALSRCSILDGKKVISQRVRVGGRYLYQATIENLSKNEAEEASKRLNQFNIHSSIIEK